MVWVKNNSRIPAKSCKKHGVFFSVKMDEFSTGSSGSSGNASGCVEQALGTHAGGQDDGS